MKKKLIWILGAAVIAGVLLQFTNPARTNPPITPGHDLFATNGPPPEIAALLRNACYDCHSYKTKWPWYSRVAPVSWWLANHVSDARKHLNFSEWPHDDPYQARKKWNRIGDEVDSGDMPLPSYTWIHTGARLSAAQRAQLIQWAATQGSVPTIDTSPLPTGQQPQRGQ